MIDRDGEVFGQRQQPGGVDAGAGAVAFDTA